MKRAVIGIMSMVLCLTAGQPVQAAEVSENLQLYAQSAVVIEAETGRIVYAKNAGARRAMASTTKIMTLLVALENADLTERVTISENAASQPEVHMDLKAGESYLMKDLLYAMMLLSYNDTAVAIAEHVAGSTEAFCELMNERAEQIGAVDTHFCTPNGLDAQEHYSTALDMAWILREVIKNEEAVSIMQTASYTIEPDAGHSRSIVLVNKNPMLTAYEGTIAGKTGFTAQAGLCLVNAAKRDDVTLITVVLGAGWPPNSSYRVSDTRKLLQYGYENFYKKEYLLHNKDTGVPVAVNDGDREFITTKIQGNFRFYVTKQDQMEIVYNLPYSLYAPWKAGDVIGEAQIKINGRIVESLPVIGCEEVIKTDIAYYLEALMCQMGLK